MGSTDRISVFGPRPYSDAIAHFSSQGKLQRLSQFYIVDSLINMLLTMSMDVILHKALLILLMVIHLMLLPLINEFILAISTVWVCCYLFDWLAQKPKYFNGFEEYVAENLKLFQDTPDLAEDFDSLICLDCTILILLFVWPAQWPKNFNVYYC